jgi:hypothetical protein
VGQGVAVGAGVAAEACRAVVARGSDGSGGSEGSNWVEVPGPPAALALPLAITAESEMPATLASTRRRRWVRLLNEPYPTLSFTPRPGRNLSRANALRT